MLHDQLQTMVPSELFQLYVSVLDELRRREIVRSTNNPIADYAEYLTAKALQLDLMARSTTGYDAIDNDGTRYEIKSRRVTSHNRSRRMSIIRGLDKVHFDILVGILFAEDFTIMRACLIPIEVVQEQASYNTHVNGSVLHLRDKLWQQPGVRDLTVELQAAQSSNAIGAVPDVPSAETR